MKEEFRSAIKKPINLLFICLGSLLMTGIFIYVHTDNYETFRNKNKSADSQLSGALLSFKIVDSDEGSSAYQNLLYQKSEIAKQLNSVLFEEPDKYNETSLELTNLRLSLREEPDFTEQVSLLQPKLAAILKDKVYFSYLTQTGEQVILKPESFGSLTLIFLSVIGVACFPVFAFLTSNILEDEFEHSSVVKGQPIPFIKRMLKKALVLYEMFIISFGLALLTSILLTQFLGNPITDFNSGSVVQLMNFIVIKNWQVISLYLIYLSVLFFFTVSLSIFLNVLLRNFYLTLILELLLFAIPILLADLIGKSPWFIGGFLIPTYLFEGNYLVESTQSLLNPVFGVAYLILASILLIWLTSILTRRGLKGVRL